MYMQDHRPAARADGRSSFKAAASAPPLPLPLPLLLPLPLPLPFKIDRFSGHVGLWQH
eukprot:COSAG02_NODE_669_length_18681_cov_170.310499_2_plen_58_part_00